MSCMLEIFGRSLPDSLWPVFRESLKSPNLFDDAHMTTVGERTVRHVLAGATALQKNAGGQAKHHFDRAISLRQGNPVALIGMACAVDLLGQPDQAKRHLEQVRKSSPDDARLLYALGLLEERCNRPQEATELYQQSLYFQPSQRGSRHRLMALALAQKDYEAAVKQAETLAAQFPLELPAWTRLGTLHLVNDDPTRAVKSFEQALKLLADNWHSEVAVGSENYEHDNWQEGVAEIQRAISQSDNSADLHVRLGDLYLKHGKSDQALAEFNEALQVNPYYLEATTKVAACHVRSNRREEAAMWLGRAIQINETLLTAYLGLSLAHSYMGHDQEAADTLDMARGIATNSPVLMAEISRLHMADSLGQDPDPVDEPRETRTLNRAALFTKAIRTHVAWLTQNKQDGAAWLRLGMLFEADKQPGQAAQAYQTATETYGGCTAAMIRLGLAAPAGDSATSGMLRRAFWPEKIDMAVHYGLSILFSQSQRFDMTAEKFAEALPDGQSDTFWRNIAMALEQMSMLNQPRNIWQSLTEITQGGVAEPVSTTTAEDAAP